MTVEFVSITPDAEMHMSFCARVSNPENQKNGECYKLLKYCIDHKHWSVFESSYMTLKINTSIMVSRQILRHRSFTFQEFSQRYSTVSYIGDFHKIELRRQDNKNRQNSIDDLDENLKCRYEKRIKLLFGDIKNLYNEMIDNGVAKECARSILPMAAPTSMYMTGNCRQWIHYIPLRESNGTQLEHQIVAKDVKKVFIDKFPLVSKALNWA